jgi:hypothetical protein
MLYIFISIVCLDNSSKVRKVKQERGVLNSKRAGGGEIKPPYFFSSNAIPYIIKIQYTTQQV